MNKPTAIVFFGIIVVGLVISGIFLANRFGETVEVTDSGDPESAAETADPAADDPADPEKTADPQPQPDSPAKEKAAGEEDAAEPDDSETGKDEPSEPEAVAGKPAFSSPEAAMRGPRGRGRRGRLRGLPRAGGRGRGAGVDPGPAETPDRGSVLLARRDRSDYRTLQVADSVRWALQFTSESGEGSEELYVDLDVSREDVIDFEKLSFPLELASGKKKEAPSPDDSKPSSPGDADAKPGGKEKMEIDLEALKDADALTVAQTFSRAVVRRDFGVARKLADPETVTDERVAALMIAVEEGDFALEEKRPFVVTLSRDDISWVLTRVKSESMGSEFALELGRVDDSWKVGGLTFSKVLSALADRGGAGDVAYSPIVEDPDGGDSLVLYFEFDDAGVTARADRQLRIVADILEEDPDRVIHINGHADALGTEDYNRALSDRRAESVRDALISLGVSPEQVVTEAYGDTRPRRPNFKPDGTDNPTGRSQNRRAEVYLDF